MRSMSRAPFAVLFALCITVLIGCPSLGGGGDEARPVDRFLDTWIAYENYKVTGDELVLTQSLERMLGGAEVGRLVELASAYSAYQSTGDQDAMVAAVAATFGVAGLGELALDEPTPRALLVAGFIVKDSPELGDHMELIARLLTAALGGSAASAAPETGSG